MRPLENRRLRPAAQDAVLRPDSKWFQLITLATLFAVAVAINYVWEMAQSFLFVGMGSIQAIAWHCFVASLGDGLILCIIHGIGWGVFRRADWFAGAGASRYGVMLGAGLVIAGAIEWVAVHVLHRWAYTDLMPVIPGLEIGVIPVLQMLLLPPLAFMAVAIIRGLPRPDPLH